MESIISELLLLANPEAQQPSMVDICELLRKVITLVNTQAILNNIMIEDQLPLQLPRLECVENRIKQLLSTCLTIEAMPDGGRIALPHPSQKSPTNCMSRLWTKVAVFRLIV